MTDDASTDREIFDAASDITNDKECVAYVENRCSGDEGKRDRILALLNALRDADGFMQTADGGGNVDSLLSDLPDDLPGSIIRNYKLLQKIGEGGFGVVYMAEQLKPVKRRVALKIIKPGMDTREIVARFEAERQALAMMDHPNIAKVLDGGAAESGHPFFVMELVNGVSITRYCNDSKLPTRERIQLFLDACAAIQHAHQKGVIHRDIKPNNILVTLHDGQPVPKVIDFGIAKALNQELTEKTLFTAYGQMIGTPQYSSPEQAEMSELDIDTRSDIYSLGVLLYELLTGETPINQEDIKEAGLSNVPRLIQDKEATRPSLLVSALCKKSTDLADSRRQDPARLISEIEGDLDWIVMKALEKDRTRRYASVGELAADVRRFLNDEPVFASPPTLLYLAGKYWKRNHRALTAVAAVFTALLFGVVGMTILYFRALDAKQEALQERTTAVEQSVRARTEREAANEAREAEATQRRLAQERAERIKDTLARADLVSGVEMLSQNRNREALTYLARSLRTDSRFLPAAQVLVSALQNRNFDIEPETILQHGKPVLSFDLNDTGNLLLSFAKDGTARIWDTATWSLRKEFGDKTPLKSASFTPRGRSLLTLSNDGFVRVWNLQTPFSQSCRFAPEGGALAVKAAASKDGSLVLATRSANGLLQVWNSATGQAITPPLRVDSELHAIDFQLSADGSRLLGQFGNRWLGCWDARAVRALGDPINIAGHTDWTASFSRYGARIVHATRNTLAVAELGSGKILGKLTFPGRIVAPAVFNAKETRAIFQTRNSDGSDAGNDGSRKGSLVTRVIDLQNAAILTESVDPDSGGAAVIHAASGVSLVRINDYQVRVRDLKSGMVMQNVSLEDRLAAAPDGSPTLIFFPSGNRFLAQLADGRFAIYMTANGRFQCACDPQPAPFEKFVFSREEQRLATATAAGTLQVWDVITGRSLTAPLQHDMSVGKILFSHGGNHIISSDAPRSKGVAGRGVLRVWNIQAGQSSSEPLGLPALAEQPMAFSTNGQMAVVSRSGQILALDLPSGKVTRTLESSANSSTRVSLDASGGMLAAFGEAGTYLWNASASKPDLKLKVSNPAVMGQFSRDGALFATVDQDHSVQVWNTSDGNPAAPALPVGAKALDVQFNPDGTRLMAVAGDSILSWDLTSPAPPQTRRRILHGEENPTLAELSPDGTRAAIANRNETSVWDVESGERTGAFAHAFNPSSLRFSPDGRRLLITGPSLDSDAPLPGLAVIWDLGSKRRIASFEHMDQVTDAQFGPDGALVVTLSKDNVLRVWQTDTGSLVQQTTKLYPQVGSFGVSSDGQTLVSLSRNQLRLWPMPPTHPDIPDWLPELAEAVAGRRIDARGHTEPIPESRLRQLRVQLAQLSGDDPYSRFIQWFLADRGARPLSSLASESQREVVQRLRVQNRPNGVRRALQMDPTNPEIHAQMSEKIAEEGMKYARRKPELTEANQWQSPAEWYTLRAIQLAPYSIETWTAHADVFARRWQNEDCLQAIDRLLELSPGNRNALYLKSVILFRRDNHEAAYQTFQRRLRELLADPNAASKPVRGLSLLLDEMKRLKSDSKPRDWSNFAVDLAQGLHPDSIHCGHADWLSQLAMETEPENDAIALARTRTLQAIGRHEEAGSVLEKLIQETPENDAYLAERAKHFTKAGQYEKALESINASLSLNASDSDQSRRRIKLYALQKLKRFDDARKLYLELHIPPRSQDAGPNQIDLSDYYNAALDEPWMPPERLSNEELSLKGLPTGLQSLDSVLFDIRGILQTRKNANRMARPWIHSAADYPEKISGINIAGKWRALHFLHGASGEFTLQTGGSRRIGCYRVRFADEHTEEIPIVLGKDLWHWVQVRGAPVETTRSSLAWRNALGIDSVRLFHSVWTNPRPGIAITHIDFVSESEVQFPFLVALTGE